MQALEHPGATLPDKAERDRAVQRTGADSVEFGLDTGQSVKLWDNVDLTWSGPFPQELIHQHYLRKITEVCTAAGCTFTSIYAGGVAKHRAQQLEDTDTHRNANLIDGGIVGMVQSKACTACNRVFTGTKRQGEWHLRHMQVIAPAHSESETRVINRYSLGPPAEPSIAPRSNGAVTGSAKLQAERRLAEPSRRRRRHRGRRR